MKLSYDSSADALYLYLTPDKKKVSESEILNDGLVVDRDKDGKVIGIEILDASSTVGFPNIFEFSLLNLEENMVTKKRELVYVSHTAPQNKARATRTRSRLASPRLES